MTFKQIIFEYSIIHSTSESEVAFYLLESTILKISIELQQLQQTVVIENSKNLDLPTT